MTDNPVIDLAELDKKLKPRKTDNRPALVMVDETKGYVPGNVVVICKRAERMLKLCSPEQRLAVLRAAQRKLEGNAQRPAGERSPLT
jgi:hypothetical protein